MLQPGATIDRYVAEYLLGQGGIAEVWAVRHTVLGTRRALKVLSVSRPGLVERLVEEGRIQARMEHPNVVPVLDVIEVDGAPALVLPLVVGMALDDVLVRIRLSESEVATVVAGLARGVSHAHQIGVAHRDIKPANVLLSLRGEALVPRVADFGLAKALAGTGGDRTRTGALLGTPVYASPEQLTDASRADHRADWWAIGVTLYELLAGRRPFEDAPPKELVRRQLSRAYLPLEEAAPGLAPAWSALVVDLMEPDPARRLADGAEVQARLVSLGSSMDLTGGGLVELVRESVAERAARLEAAPTWDPAGSIAPSAPVPEGTSREHPSAPPAAEPPPASDSSLDALIGHVVGHYRVLSMIGQGGMGVVYRALDTRLGRAVALKFLSPRLATCEDARLRFAAEARHAATLDHPNICSVYEINDSEERPYIVMPFIEGERIADRIERGPLGIADVVRIGREVARGLHEAHERGIVHRDIKPSNLMETKAGHVKIMDFGIARSADRTRITDTGTTLGTVHYMSPEQAMAEEVDRRTDIWSLGVTLYEMAAGVLPFKGSGGPETMYAILNSEPAPLTGLRTGVPLQLEAIVAKCLQKNQDHRYQTATDLRADLSRLAEEMTSPPSASRERVTARTAAPRRRRVAWLAGGLFAVAGVGLAIFQLVVPPPAPFTASRSLQVTSTAEWEGEPAISPDGGRIAYASSRAGNLDVYLIDAHGGQPLRLTHDPAADYDPAWFPDGSALAFVSERDGSASIWKTGQLGGAPTLLLPRAHDPAVAPDGEHLAFTSLQDSGLARIGVVSLLDRSEPLLVTGDADGLWNHRHPAWSPDGGSLCYAAREALWVVEPDGEGAHPLTEGMEFPQHPTWTPDGTRVYFSSERGGNTALWSVPVRGGAASRVTMGTGSERHPSFSADGTRLAYSTEASDHDVVVQDVGTGEEWIVPSAKYESMPSLVPDHGGLVFVSDRRQVQLDLWYLPLTPTEGDEPRRITDQPDIASHPAVSPDGEWIAYYRVVGDQRDLWTVPVAGGPSAQVTRHEASDIQPAWSPDGSQLAFASDRSGTLQIWRVAIEDGHAREQPARVTEEDGATLFAPTWSPEGTRIAYIRTVDDESDVWCVPVDGSAPPTRLTTGAHPCRLRWPSESTLVVSGRWDGESLGMRLVDLVTGDVHAPPHPIDFGWRAEECFFDVTEDGSGIAHTRRSTSGDLWILEAGP